MARIPQEQLERLKEEISVQRLVESAGVELKRVGKEWAGRCPFHEDDTASLIVTPAKNLWHCFGCQCGGGPIDWVMKHKAISFRHAVELLKEDSSLAAEGARALKHSGIRALPAPVRLDDDDRAMLRQVVQYYHHTLKSAPEALAYLQARGLAHPELIDHFKLGFANRTLGLRLPEKTRAAGAQLREQLARIGIYRASGHEHFNGSLIVPLLDEAGNVHEIYGRKIGQRLTAGTPLHMYLPANAQRGRGVFNEVALQASPEIIVCEALLDALTFWCAGYRNVTSAYGVEGFTDEMLQAFKRHGVKRALIAYDRDEAGELGAAKLARRLMDEGIECFRIQFPKGMDANQYALKVQPASKSLGLLIRQAMWMGQGKAPKVSTVEAEPAPAVEPEPPPPPPLAAQTLLEPPPPPPEPLPASPMPEAAQQPLIEVVSGERGHEVHVIFGQASGAPLPGDARSAMPPAGVRSWRVRGLDKNLAPDLLKINLRVAIATKQGGAFHVDTLDLYNAKQRAHFVAQAQAETGLAENMLKADIGRVLMALESVQDQAIAKALAPKADPAMPQEEQQAALALLRTPDLAARIVADFEAIGVTGESTNCLAGYLAAVSRKLERPLAIVIQSSSAAGKSSLMDAVLSFVPEAERIQYSAMTGQSLFYMGQSNLKHKILAIAEEEGAHRAAYALKLLQSEGELTIASTGADPQTGNLVTQEYRVQGPVSLFMTTTAIDIDEELMNRCLVLSVNEEREQTRAIHRLQRQRRTLAGLERKQQKQSILTVHQNAQRLLRPLPVINPWAESLTFLDERTRTRRDHEKYLTLIDAIALLHQHQRQIKSAEIAGEQIEYIEASLSDIELANRIAHQVLGTSLDELPPQTRRVLAAVQQWVNRQMQEQGALRQDIRFNRAQVRALTGSSDTQARIHLERLAALEYLLVHRGKRGQSYEYELLHDGDVQDERPHLPGLIDTQTLRQSAATNQSSRGPEAHFAPPTRGQNAPDAGPSRPLKNPANPHESRPIAQIGQAEAEIRFRQPAPAQSAVAQASCSNAVSSLAA
jgi:DNA primase catalytic core